MIAMARAKLKASKLTLTSQCPECTGGTGQRRDGSDIHEQLSNTYVGAGIAWHKIQRENEHVVFFFFFLLFFFSLFFSFLPVTLS